VVRGDGGGAGGALEAPAAAARGGGGELGELERIRGGRILGRRRWGRRRWWWQRRRDGLAFCGIGLRHCGRLIDNPAELGGSGGF